ncbi:hypothetical protein D9M70_334640 [compost metagenome]
MPSSKVAKVVSRPMLNDTLAPNTRPANGSRPNISVPKGQLSEANGGCNGGATMAQGVSGYNQGAATAKPPNNSRKAALKTAPG